MPLFAASVGIKILTFSIPSICIWLSFIFSERQYFRICNKCHYCLLRCCHNRAKYKLNKLRMQNNTQQYQDQVSRLPNITSVVDIIDATHPTSVDVDVSSLSQSNPYVQFVK